MKTTSYICDICRKEMREYGNPLLEREVKLTHSKHHQDVIVRLEFFHIVQAPDNHFEKEEETFHDICQECFNEIIKELSK